MEKPITNSLDGYKYDFEDIKEDRINLLRLYSFHRARTGLRWLRGLSSIVGRFSKGVSNER